MKTSPMSKAIAVTLAMAVSVAFAGCSLYDTGAHESYIVRAGLLATANEDWFCYHDLESWDVVFRWPIRSNSD